jgi:peptidoglycan/xylan/chitin deacetylase (PgdA/CDA1 family)
VGPALAHEIRPLESRGQEGVLKVAALLYHDVVDDGHHDESGFPGAAAGRYKLRTEDFERHLEALARGAEGPPAVVDDPQAGRHAVPWLLTFDDGGSSALGIGEQLAKRGWLGHFFVTVDYIGTAGFLTPDAIRLLSALGHVIGSHSCSHPERMSRCTREELLYEWGRSREVLSEILDRPVTVASVPAGHYGKNVARAAAAAGIKTLFTSEPVLKTREVDSCRVVGRFTIQRGVQPDTAVAFARARPFPRTRQFAFWNLKKAAKTVGGERYLRLRQWLLSSSLRKAQ